MRLNRYLAAASDLSRRAADLAITEGRVKVNDQAASLGQEVGSGDKVSLDGQEVIPAAARSIVFYKPAGVICSRRGQGNSPTIYDVLPAELAQLNPVGRLDKDTSGLLIMTSDGQLHQLLSHPSRGKTKLYEVTLDKGIDSKSLERLQAGVELEDGPSRPAVKEASGAKLVIELSEGRNRQVRRTFAALGYTVVKLHRPAVGEITLKDLKPGQWRELLPEEFAS